MMNERIYSRASLLMRAGLVSAGCLLLHAMMASAGSASLTQTHLWVLTIVLLGGLGLLLIGLAGLRRVPASLSWIILLALLIELLIGTARWIEDTQSTRQILNSQRAGYEILDSGLLNTLGAELLRQGENPYVWDLGGMYDIYRAATYASTPRTDGSSVEHYSYPSLVLLLTAAVDMTGLPGTLTVSLASYISLLLLLFRSAPPLLRPIILLPLAVTGTFEFLLVSGSLDVVWVAFVTAMILAWHKPGWRAVLYGLAVSSKQQPWLILPFLLVYLYYTVDAERPRSSLWRIGFFVLVSGAVFLLVNSPFIISDAGAWLRGTTLPFWDSLIIYSAGGLSSLNQLGWLHLPRSYFTFATVIVLLILLFLYSRHHRLLRDTLWMLPGVFVWFSYRNLSSYWLFWTIPILAALVVRFRRAAPAIVPVADVRWQTSLAVAGAGLVLLIVAGVVLNQPASVVLQPVYPVYVWDRGRVNVIEVEVTNNSSTQMSPRFFVQGAGQNILPWAIESGPLTLAGGERARYRIANQTDSGSVPWVSDFQLYVTDASGEATFDGSYTVEADRSWLFPDVIKNPRFRYWTANGTRPIHWTLVNDLNYRSTASLSTVDGRTALRLAAPPVATGVQRAVMETELLMPHYPVGIWVRRPAFTMGGGGSYGLEIDDGAQTVRLIFADTSRSVRTSESTLTVEIAAPVDTWIYQEIDFAQLYRDNQLELPVLQFSTYESVLEGDLRLVYLRFFIEAREAADEADQPLNAYFGEIVQQPQAVTPQVLMDESLNDPYTYYVRLAALYQRQRNYSRALAAYETALGYTRQPDAVVAAKEALCAAVPPTLIEGCTRE